MIAYRTGEKVGPYQVVQQVGRGSFGVVLLARDPARGRQQFALKIVPCDHLDVGAAHRAREAALAEAELLQRLRHPHVVSCYAVCWDEARSVVWIALDYMDGGDMQSLIDGRRNNKELPVEISFARRVLETIGSALRFIHSQGILHRDVKPSNLLLHNASSLERAEIKMADFGISKIIEATGCASTVVGTPPYMSPEIVCGKPYGAASDVWALGCCLYELLTLKRPFEAANQLALVRQIVEHQPAPLPAGTSADFARTILGLLEKDPLKRLSLDDVLDSRLHTPHQEMFQVNVQEVNELEEESWNPVVSEQAIGEGRRRRDRSPSIGAKPQHAFGAPIEEEGEKSGDKSGRSERRRWFTFGKPRSPQKEVPAPPPPKTDATDVTYVSEFVEDPTSDTCPE